MMVTDKKEEISHRYYSNCLLETVKAKIRNPGIEIITWPIPGSIIPHFLWLDGNHLYDFGSNSAIHNWLIYKGCIRRRPKYADTITERSGENG